MTQNAVIQILLYAALLTALSIPIGTWLFHILAAASGERPSRIFLPRLTQMDWRSYAASMMIFSFVCLAFLYLILRLQYYIPLNERGLSGMSADLAFNTAVSFVTNTNWQAYGGESTLSQFSQMIGLTVQYFVSAAVGLCVMAALFRSFKNREAEHLGNFWRDLFGITIYFLLPLSFVCAVFLVWQGVPQTFKETAAASTYESAIGGTPVEGEIPLGPVASQIAIKQLGTNGGGIYNVNSAHPFENPTPFSNLIEAISILLISAGCCHTFGMYVGDRRQGWAIYGVMLFVLLIGMFAAAQFESAPKQEFYPKQVDLRLTPLSPGGNMEGKEVRFGIAGSAMWAAATTAASNGSVNSMHDSYTPLGGMVPLVLMQFAEIIFGGTGSGLYGMLAFVILTVFIAGLMVGRTPEYLGKKIESFEMKMVSLVVLVPCLVVLIGTAIAVAFSGQSSVSNPGPHGFSQILYAYSSMGNNNGSAFGGFGGALPLNTIVGGIVMFISRYWIIIPILALAGSLSRKKIVPKSSGTLETHTLLFSSLLLAIIVIVGALTFIPALVLGPIVEHLL